MVNVALFVLTCCAVPLTVCLCRESITRHRLDAYWLERSKPKGPGQEA